MANLSPIRDVRKISLNIKQYSYLMDHRFEGHAVFPAVEAMQILAASTKACLPEINTDIMLSAGFDKFLILHNDQHMVAAFHELCQKPDGQIESKLVTRMKSKNLAISRPKEHVTVCFQSHKTPATQFPLFEDLMSLEGKTFTVSSHKIYRELVPFGPSYHNITDDLRISSKGVVANLAAPKNEASTDPLGSVFPLDAAFHGACVWCQCFLRFIGFPVGFEKRVIFQPTVPGGRYVVRITPIETSREMLTCDLWICDPQGHFFESISGLKMRDVSAGRSKPPEWIMNMQPLDTEM